MRQLLELKAEIVRAGISQFELAMRADIDHSRLSKIIHGWIVPKPDEKNRISEVLNKKPDELFV